MPEMGERPPGMASALEGLLLLKSLNIARPQGIMDLLTLSLGYISINDATLLSNQVDSIWNSFCDSHLYLSFYIQSINEFFQI